MIYRPHFTYIEAATPEQRQAREAAANEEWRKRLIFHSELHPEWRIIHPIMPFWHPPRREPIINPPRIHILPLPIIRPYENRQEHGTPVRTPVGTPVRLPNDIHVLPSPTIRPHESEPEHEPNRPIGITITQPPHGKPLMLPPIIRPHESRQEHEPEITPPREPIINLPGIHILPLPIIRPHEEQHESNPPHGTPVKIPVGTPVRLSNDIHILPSPVIRESNQEQQESNENRPIGITITQPHHGIPLMLPPTHETSHRTPTQLPHDIRIVPSPIYENSQENTSNAPHGTPVTTPVGTPVRLPNDIHIVPSPIVRQEQNPSEGRPIGITITQPHHGIPLMLPPTHEPEHEQNPSHGTPVRLPHDIHIVPSPNVRQEQQESGENRPIGITVTQPPRGKSLMLPPSTQHETSPPSQRVNTLVGRILSFIHQAEGVSTSPPPTQQTNNTPPQQTVPATIGRALSGIEHAEGVSTSPPPPPPSPLISQGVNLPAQTSPPPANIIANAATSQKSSNPFAAIGSFFGSLGSDIANAAKDVGNAITGALSTANNAIQNAYSSVYGNQEKQQLQNQLNQLQTQAQQELSQIQQEKQQLQNELQQVQQYEAQAEQMLQQNPNNQQLQSYLQQLQQAQQQIQQGLAQLNQAQQQIQTQLQQAQQQIQQELNKGQGNPFQQFFNDIAEGSALVGYYGTELLGGAGEELAHIAQGKGLENFSQAISQFNKAGGQNVAKAVGDVTEVALPAIATAIVAPELLPAELIGEAASVGIGEGISKLTTGKWQSLPQVLQEANEGGVLGVIGGAAGSALEGGLAKLGTAIGGKVGDIIAGAGGKALAGAAVNEALTAPFTRNPEQLLLAGVLGAAGGAAGELVSKVPWLEQSEAVRNAIDTSEAGAKLGNKLVNEGITKGVLTPEEIEGKTTTEIGDLLRQKYSTVSNDLISSLDKDTIENLKEKGIITDNQILKPDEFIKSVKGKIPDDQLRLLKDTADLVEKYNEGIEKLVGGYKLKIGNRTLLYRLKLGDESELGLGSAGKSEIFNEIRTINDIEKNVAGIYNNPSDVRDTAIGLKTTPKEAEFVQNLYEAAKAAKSALSDLKPTDNIELSFRDLEKDLGKTQTKILAQTVKDYLENEIGGKNVIVYGSNSVKQYLEDIARRLGGTLDKDSDPNAYLIKKGDQVIWQWRKPGDVDVFIRTDNPNDLQRIAQDLADRMNKAIGSDRFEAEGNLVIDKITGDHIVDLHMMNEASDNFNLYARGSTGADLGMMRPTPNYADLGVAKVSQIALDKANAVAGLRETALNDLLKQINEGTRIDNPDYVVYIVKQILKNKDPETIEDALAYFVRNIKDDNLRDYLADRFSQEFNIPKNELFTKPIGNIEDVLNERYRYLSPASYRFKDAQDFLTLLKLAADLRDDDNLRALYEQLRDEFEERGIIPKDWEPKELDLNVVQNAQRLIDSMTSAGDVESMMFFTSPIISSISSPPPSPIVSPPPSPIVSPPPSPVISPPPSPIVSPPPSPIISPPPSPIISPPPSPIISPPPSPIISPPPSPIVNPPPSPTVNPPPSPIINPPPSPIVNPPPSPIINPPPSPIISPPPSPIINPPPPPSSSDYVQTESQSPPPVFSASSVTQSESPMPMGPPPMLPAIIPGGFGGEGRNNQEISGMAGESIYL